MEGDAGTYVDSNRGLDFSITDMKETFIKQQKSAKTFAKVINQYHLKP